MFEYRLLELARKKIKKIVLPESSDERILRAAEIILRRGVARVVLLGEKEDGPVGPRGVVLQPELVVRKSCEAP